MPSTRNVHVDQALSNLSLAYTGDGEFVADQVFLDLPVDKKTNKYYVYGQENFRADDDIVAPAAEADEMNWTLSTDSYFCEAHAKSSVIPYEEDENQDDVLDVETDTTIMLTEQILRRKEVNAVSAVTAGLTAVDLTGAGVDLDATDPVAVVDAAKLTIRKKTGKRANRLLLPEPVLIALRNNAKVKSRVSGAQNLGASAITIEQLAVVMGVEKIVEANAIKATTKEGQAQSNDYIWGKNMLLYYAPPAAGPRTVSLGYSMNWVKGKLAAPVYRFLLETRHALKIEARRYYDTKVVAAGAGVLWSNAIA